MQLLRSLTVWFLILLGAIANGGLREAVLLPRLGTLPAFVLSGALLALVILGVALASIGWLRIHRASSALKTGAFWLLLTLGFEFGLDISSRESPGQCCWRPTPSRTATSGPWSWSSPCSLR